MSDGGKGWAQRPIQDRKQFEENWDRIFGKNKVEEKEFRCNPHPNAPHGFDRNMSHSLGRYVCDCEFWEPEDEQ